MTETTTKKKTPRGGNKRPEVYKPAPWEKVFLEIYAESGNVSMAAKAAGVHRATVYEWKKYFPEFADKMEDSRQEAIGVLVGEAFKRAKESSDTLLIFLLKNLEPETFGDRAKVIVGGDKESPVQHTHEVKMPEVGEMRDYLAELVGVLQESGLVDVIGDGAH
jgi:hypothetical protein